MKSTVVDLPLHWVPEINQHARCATAGCFLCEAGDLAKQHTTVVVEGEDGTHRLLELSEQHVDVASKLRDRDLLCIGSLLRVKLSTDANAGREIELLIDRLHTKPVPCANYCRAIGRKGYDRARQLSLFSS